MTKQLDGRRTYRLYRSGPGDGSTYRECWGQGRTSRGHLLAEGRREVIERAIQDEGGWDDGLDIYEYDRESRSWSHV